MAAASGDIVVGDEDGVVVVPQERIAETIARLTAVKAAEAALDAKVKAGLKLPEWIQKMIDNGQFQEV